MKITFLGVPRKVRWLITACGTTTFSRPRSWPLPPPRCFVFIVCLPPGKSFPLFTILKIHSLFSPLEEWKCPGEGRSEKVCVCCEQWKITEQRKKSEKSRVEKLVIFSASSLAVGTHLFFFREGCAKKSTYLSPGGRWKMKFCRTPNRRFKNSVPKGTVVRWPGYRNEGVTGVERHINLPSVPAWGWTTFFCGRQH